MKIIFIKAKSALVELEPGEAIKTEDRVSIDEKTVEVTRVATFRGRTAIEFE